MMTMKAISTVLCLAVAITVLATPVLAIAAIGGGPVDEFKNPIDSDPTDDSVGTHNFSKLLTQIIRFLLGITGSLALIAIIWGGISYIIALGDDKKLQNAKNTILWAVVGFLIVAMAFVFIETLEKVFL